MFLHKRIIITVALLCAMQAYAQHFTIQFMDSGRQCSLRGLSVVNDDIIWASGSNGNIARSTDGGKTFSWIIPAGFETRDFRDIEAFDSNTAIIMAIAEPAVMLKTVNGGKSWDKVFESNARGMFLDAMDFDLEGNGIVVGDPINNKLFIATTDNYGDSWRILKDKHNTYTVSKGEAMFASSGTNVQTSWMKNKSVFIVTGGIDSRLFVQGQPIDLSIQKGMESTGANSVAVNDYTGKVVIAGGDFNNPLSGKSNLQLLSFKDDKILSTLPQTPPAGYRSCVEFIANDTLITCGITGADISTDGGLNWQQISTESFHVCQKAKLSGAIFLAGKNGRIAKLIQHKN